MSRLVNYAKLISAMLLIVLGLHFFACENTDEATAGTANNGVDQANSKKSGDDSLNGGDADADSDGDGDQDADKDGDKNGNEDGDQDGDADADGDGDDNSKSTTTKKNSKADEESCAEQEFEVERFITRLIILLDASGSMAKNQKWANAKKAINATLEKYDFMLDIGFDTFPDSFGNAVFSMGAMCGVNGPMLVDCAQENGEKIKTKMNSIKMFANSSAMTPLGCAMRKFTQENYAPNCLDKHFPTYLLVISDGVDTCGLNCNNPQSSGQTGGIQGAANPKKQVEGDQYVEITTELLDEGIKTFVVGFGEGADPDDLNAIASSGGTTRKEYIDAKDGDTLLKALGTIVSSVITCSFSIGDQDQGKVDLDKTNLYTFDKDGNKKVLGLDQGCTKDKGGWTWANDERTSIDLCEKTCQRLKNGSLRGIEATFGCPPTLVV